MPWQTNNWVTCELHGTVNGSAWDTEYTYRSTTQVYNTHLQELADIWQADVIPPLISIMHAGANISYLKVWNRSIPTAPVMRPVGIPGSFTTDPLDYPAGGLSFGIYKQVGLTYEADTDDLESGRPINRGYMFGAGLSDDWMEAGAVSVPPSGVTPLAAFLTALKDSPSVLGNILEPIVFGAELPAIVPPKTPKPARTDEVYAGITDLYLQKVSALKSRQGPFG